MPIFVIDSMDIGRRVEMPEHWGVWIPQDEQGWDVVPSGTAVVAPSSEAAIEFARERWGEHVVGVFQARGMVCHICGLVGGH